MKLRSYFVSNSSSCSFICQCCNLSIEGHDSQSPEDYDMTQLLCGHNVCKKHLVKIDENSFRKEAIQILNEISLGKDYYNEQSKRSLLLLNNCEYEIEEFTNIYKNGSGCEYIISQCPICSPNYYISDSNLLEYILMSRGLSREEIESEFRKKFEKIEDFNKGE